MDSSPEGEGRVQWDNRAGRAPALSHTARGGSQGQPRAKIIRHIHGDEVRGRARIVSQQGRSGSGPRTATRISHSLRITRQVHNDGQRPWSSWEVSLWAKVQVQITGVSGQAQPWLLLWPGPSSKTSTHSPAGMARAPLPRYMAATAPQVLSKLSPSPWIQPHQWRSAHSDTHFLFGGSSRSPMCHRHSRDIAQLLLQASHPSPQMPRAFAW